MAEHVSPVPCLDCGLIGISNADESLNEEGIALFGERFNKALVSHGVCYLKNHGVKQALLDEYMTASQRYFCLPEEEKAKLKRTRQTQFGWVRNGDETSNPERPPDLREVFDYCPGEEGAGDVWLDTDFERRSKELFEAFSPLVRRLCDALSLSLGQERSYIANAHKLIGREGNQTTLRSLFYLPIDKNTRLKPGQIRSGEHTDFGSFTLLFQDDIGGLEVEIPGQGFVPAAPIPNTLLVIAGNLLQRWTSDGIKASVHRVVIPESQKLQRVCRQSITLFVRPDGEFKVKPLDGTRTYEPVRVAAYLKDRFYESHV